MRPALNKPTIVLASLTTTAVLVIGYVALGLLPMFIFAFGFVGGLAVWLRVPSRASFRSIRAPYIAVLVLFVVHKAEERYMEFFPALSEITGVPVPEIGSVVSILLLASAAAWLLVPFLIGRSQEFGYYLAWTFFCSMGVTELAHFVFPFFLNEPYGYFPGMASVFLLAPLAWWGMIRLAYRGANASDTTHHDESR